MLRALNLHKQHAKLRRSCSLNAGGSLLRRRVSCSASADVTNVTSGQKLRGHGKGGWKEAGWDYSSPTKLDPKLREMIMHYGQLAQATYDRMGLDPCQPTWGFTTEPAGKLIDYLTQDYPLAPGMNITTDTPAGTNQIYKLPKSDNLSPLIYASPAGKDADAAAAEATSRMSLNRMIDNVIDRLFVGVASLPIELIGGSRPLFRPYTDTGRGLDVRPTFMGFVAVSQPAGPEDEVDVAFVWRGTIYKEEWAANFGQDMLYHCTWEAFDGKDSKKIAQPLEVGVHDGFQDLYLRRTKQPLPNSAAVPAELPPDDKGALAAPAEVVRKWMVELMRTHNVTTFSTTGHSLGGALSTVSAFDIARELDHLWKTTTDEARAAWATKAKPKVSAIPFAPPRVGNWTFARDFEKLQVKELRICNVKDVVPMVPGIWVQALTSIWYRLGINVYNDANSRAARAFGWLYFVLCQLISWVWPAGPLARWGYFHVGTILEVNSDTEFDGVGATPSPGQCHNLEVYLYLLSKKGRDGQPTDRNPLLLNKSDNILVNEKDFPADWWRYPQERHVKMDGSGRWTTDPTRWPSH